MISIEVLRAFFGWCSAINIGVLILGTIGIVTMRGPMAVIHSKLFGLSPEEITREYFHYLALYKLAIGIFNLVPYLVLWKMS